VNGGFDRITCRRKAQRWISNVAFSFGESSSSAEISVADVADLERNEVASAKLAVDAQVEERALAHSVQLVDRHLTGIGAAGG
jgi:hypothetical protein